MVEIYIVKKTGEKFTILIDFNDLERLITLGYHWHVAYSRTNDTFYVCSTRNHRSFYLHRFLTNANDDEIVDHINHDALDNRKYNLRITHNIKNTKHRKGKNKNNKSGYRNVSWNSKLNKWVVQLQVDGKNKVLGYFANIKEAASVAEKMREKYYGEFKGAS